MGMDMTVMDPTSLLRKYMLQLFPTTCSLEEKQTSFSKFWNVQPGFLHALEVDV